MNYKFTSNLSQSDFDKFAQTHTYGTFFQSSAWAKVKANWTPIYTGVYEKKELVAVSLVLKRKLFLSYSFMYAPRGPLLDYNNKQLLSFYLENLKQLAKENTAVSLTLDPSIERASYSMQAAMSKDIDIKYDDSFVTVFESLDFNRQDLGLDLHDTIQPRFQPVVNFDKESLAVYEKSRGFKSGEKAKSANVKIRRISIDELDQFIEVIEKTEEAKNISLRGEDYFTKLIENFKEKSLVSIAYLDLAAELKSLVLRKEDMKKRLDNPTIKAGRRREYESQLKSINKETVYINKKIKEKGNTVNISGVLALRNDTKAELLYAGMDRDFMKYLGSNLNYLDAIDWAIENNCDSLYFGGSSGHLNEGIDRFKATFDPSLDEYIGEFVFENKKLLNFIFEKALVQ